MSKEAIAMKILYATQCTSAERINRTGEIVALLRKRAEVEVLVSGSQGSGTLPFEVHYQYKGLGFSFGKSDGVELWNSYWKKNARRFHREIKSLPLQHYDLIISDFEPVSAWAAAASKIEAVGLSSQLGALHPLAPKSRKAEAIGSLMLERYAPTSYNYGFHFKPIENTVYTPIISREIRDLTTTNEGHYTVFLPSYNDEKIIKNLKPVDSVQWQLFSTQAKKEYALKNFIVKPMQREQYLKSLASAKGLLCHANFGSASEALFLRKKLLVVPQKANYEQSCYAAMLKSMQVPVAKRLRKIHSDSIVEWLADNSIVEVDYPDITEQILETIIQNHAGMHSSSLPVSRSYPIFQ